ncbi:MAG: bifunctional phosphoserine phosphatase/homoserine phosphotransferase ThrH [Roseiflexaceae bacterium]|nr:bifunctional phosphoserine phosphatase/homoserine phosphotransferase ThrH [Roseiflexaceae bacterium]
MTQPTILATDLEGVLVPEIWVAVAERTGIERLRLTTRDVPDYDELMRGRLALLREHRLTLADIQRVISAIDPLPGAVEALARLRARVQVIILSDTYYEFAMPLMAKLGWPTLFCHSLEVDAHGMITNYRLRLPDSKTAAVRALRELRFRVLAIGNSYNDVGMLTAADVGALFEPPQNVVADFPHFPVLHGYDDLLAFVEREAERG